MLKMNSLEQFKVGRHGQQPRTSWITLFLLLLDILTSPIIALHDIHLTECCGLVLVCVKPFCIPTDRMCEDC